MKLERSVIQTLDKTNIPEELKNALRQSDRSELVSLYSPDNISQTHEHLEALLEEHPDDNILRLLWAHSHISLDILPLSFIASSVYEVLQNCALLTTAPRLAFLVVSPLAIKLGEHEEYRIGLLILGHILSSNPQGFFADAGERSAFCRLAQCFIDEEKHLALERKESKSYFDFIDSVSKDLVAKQNGNHTLVPDEHAEANSLPPLQPVISEDYILGEPTDEFKNSKLHALNSNTLNSDPASSEIPDIRKSNTISYLVAVFCIVMLLMIYHFRETIVSFASSLFPVKIPVEDRLILAVSDSSLTAPSMTPLPPFYSLSPGSNRSLDEIDKRLKNISTGNGSSKNTSPDQSPAQVGSTPYSDINDIEPLITIPEDGESIPEAKIPEAKPIPVFSGRRGETSSPVLKPEDLGSSEKKQDISGNQQNPARSPAQRQADMNQSNTTSPQVGTSTSDESGVEKFDPPLVYETITATNVVSAPTLFSPSIVRLHAKSLVEVTARIGVWLEIRSNAGQSGYILAQDARQSDRPNSRRQ
jgi:hypothetical protein